MASSSSSGGAEHMATDPPSGPSRRRFQEPPFTGFGNAGNDRSPGQGGGGGGGSSYSASQFDIFEWYPRYQSCQKYFLDHSQHSVPVRALAAFINILLPCQRQPNPIVNSSSLSSPSPTPAASAAAGPSSRPAYPFPGPNPTPQSPSVTVSLIPYVRRLVATGMDFPGVLHGFFGDDWASGIGSLHEQERRNFLFAAKSGGWASVKRDYDMGDLETVPFLRPLQGISVREVEAAESAWSDWLWHEDWMIGTRGENEGGSTAGGGGNGGEGGRSGGRGRA